MDDTPLPPLKIVDGERFTICHFAGGEPETLEVAKDVDGDLVFHSQHDGTVAIIAAADIPRFIDGLCRLTGYTTDPIKAARRVALDQAAREVDCGCSCSADVLAAETKADRWRACGEACCGALMARDIRALAEPTPATNPS